MDHRYHYKGYDAEGHIEEGEVSAASVKEAALALRESGISPIRIGLAGKRRLSRGKYPGRRALSLLAGEWAALLSAGLPMTEALSLLQSSTGKRERTALSRVEEGLSAGKGVAESLTGGFPPFFVSLATVGEATGTLPETLTRLSLYYKEEEERLAKLKSALAYPLFVTAFALAVLVLVFTFILPSFGLLFDALGITVPPLAAALLSWGLFLRAHAVPLAGGAAILVLAGLTFWKSAAGRRFLSHMLYRHTWYRRLLLIRFCAALSAFLESGRTLTASLLDVRPVVGEEDAEAAISRMAGYVGRGLPFAEAMHRSGFTLPIVEGLVHVGMESGELPRFLREAARLMTEEADRAFARFRAILEPVMLLAVGALTALLLFSVMLPVFHAAGQAVLR